ncbi:MAG: intracellular sulfur oxidation DsrE/DsrF family protein [Cellvibrionaceae bacterium]|jgi:intracellular sulfur oxidation DsrE/DsrF family protein
MRHRLVAAALHFPFNCTARLLLTTLAATVFCCFVLLSFAQIEQAPPASKNGYLARILNDSPEEVAQGLKRAEALYLEGKLTADTNPIAIVLHGPEVEVFFKDHYEEYKTIVDLAARLSAFGVVGVRVCETQSGIMGRSRSSIHPFIGTVPFGPTEVRRLLDQQSYVYF